MLCGAEFRASPSTYSPPDNRNSLSNLPQAQSVDVSMSGAVSPVGNDHGGQSPRSGAGADAPWLPPPQQPPQCGSGTYTPDVGGGFSGGSAGFSAGSAGFSAGSAGQGNTMRLPTSWNARWKPPTAGHPAASGHPSAEVCTGTFACCSTSACSS